MERSDKHIDTGEMIVKRVSVPVGLEELMEGLAKEVLLKKPEDIYLFAAKYFSKLLLLRDKGSYKGTIIFSFLITFCLHFVNLQLKQSGAPKPLQNKIDDGRTRNSSPKTQLSHCHVKLVLELKQTRGIQVLEFLNQGKIPKINLQDRKTIWINHLRNRNYQWKESRNICTIKVA